MLKKLKNIPKFKTEEEERLFWQKADSTEYLDWSKAERVSFPNLKLTSKPITIRLPQSMIDRLKIEAHKRDMPYQTMIKDILFRGLAKA
jgi:predicted DNA binding CopG/RHH family protein